MVWMNNISVAKMLGSLALQSNNLLDTQEFQGACMTKFVSG